MVTVFAFLLMLEVLSPKIPYKLTAMFYEFKAANEVTMKYMESGVAVDIAVNPVILNPPVIMKHLSM